jgi:hypothetical protein
MPARSLIRAISLLGLLLAVSLGAVAADVSALRARALQGDASAALDLGNLYFEGREVPKNLTEAGRWWGHAAKKGNEVARHNLIFLNPPKATQNYNEVKLLGVEGKGHRLVFVIDQSGSMEGARFQAACAALIQTLRALPPEVHFMIYFFDTRAEAMPKRGLVPASPENIDFAVKWVEAQRAGGGTDPSQALRWAFALRPDTIWLLSDGEFIDQAFMLKELNPKRATRINTIAFQDESGGEQLQRIASENGGIYRFVK